MVSTRLGLGLVFPMARVSGLRHDRGQIYTPSDPVPRCRLFWSILHTWYAFPRCAFFRKRDMAVILRPYLAMHLFLQAVMLSTTPEVSSPPTPHPRANIKHACQGRHHSVQAGVWGDAIFKAETVVRPDILLSILGQGFKVLWTDVDMVWMDDPLPLLPNRQLNATDVRTNTCCVLRVSQDAAVCAV